MRKPSSVLKSVLHPQGSYDPEYKPGWAPFNQDLVPSRVAEVGLVVSGALEEVENGWYECIDRERKDDEGCNHFRHKDDGEFAVRRRPGAHCRHFVDHSYHAEWCWVLEPYTESILEGMAPLYVQLFDGELPEPLSSSDVHLEEKAWKRSLGPLEYEPFKDLRVAPNIQDGKVLLGLMDTVFLLAYTVGLFISGYIADRVDIRRFLAAGMVSSGFSSVFLCLGHRFRVHALSYFLIVSIWGGLSQSVGWPCVVTVMGRWFPRTYRRRGLIMGAWSSNLFVGNILGSIITTASVGWGLHGENWPLGFELPGYIVIVFGLLVWKFLEATPLPSDEDPDSTTTAQLLEEQESFEADTVDFDNDSPAPTLTRALLIPGVIPFSLCLAFAKICQYALLFWGPYYLQVVGFSSERAGYLCSFFDVGALLGGFGSGWISDRLGAKRGLTAALFLAVASVSLYIYYEVTSKAGDDVAVNVWMMILVGFWVNGPVSLITTSVSQELGSHPSLNGDERLIASVTGIIDGTGSFGAAMQGILIGVISTSSWEKVFQFLIVCCLLSASLLSGVVKKELFSS